MRETKLMIEDVGALVERVAVAAEKGGFVVERLLDMEEGDLLGFTRELDGEAGLPWVYLSAGMHGDEPSGPLAVTELMEEGFFGGKVNWMICPIINPRGLALGTRENPEGVDMNRDYLKCTTREIIAHVDWLEAHPVSNLALSLHEDWESTGIYLYEINTRNLPSLAMDLLEAAAPYFEKEPELVIDNHEVTGRGWIYHGSEPDLPEGWPEAIWLAKNGCPRSYTLETPSSADLRQRVECHKAMVRRAVEKLLGESSLTPRRQ